MKFAPGVRLGNYEIVSAIGAGGMGEVYRARDLRLGRDVALKVLSDALASDPQRLARFEQEARTVASLNHPNIVTLFSVEDAGENRFLTMELIEGTSLDARVSAEGMPFAQVIDLGIALAEALHAAHTRGAIHRDLKPANVMLTNEGRVKVLDFGLAKLAEIESETDLDATQATPLSTAGEVIGTVPYMAPEQIRGEMIDARTDLFALGVLLYEVIAGRRPFSGATMGVICSAILRDDPVRLSEIRLALPAELDRIVRRCLEKHPGARYQTASAVVDDLRAMKRNLEGGLLSAVPKRASASAISIAVLPFANRSASAEDEYFSDGLADELLNVLGKIRGLRVAARTSSFVFKGKAASIEEVGRALNVATVLEGSVRKAGNRVRISVQLAKVDDGFHLWSESYDRTLDDIFAVQDDIAQCVVKELRATLLGEGADPGSSGRTIAEVSQAVKGRGTNPEAHRLVLQGRYFASRITREGTAKAIAHLTEALALDPNYAYAWSALAGAHISNANSSWCPPAEGYAEARKALLRALELEPNLAEAHAKLGWIRLVHERDEKGAEESYRKALALAPDNAEVLAAAGVFALKQLRIEDSLAHFRRSLELDPLASAAAHNLGMTLRAADRVHEAEAAFRRSIEISPQRIGSRCQVAMCVLSSGRIDHALAEARLEPDEAYRLWALAMIQFRSGRRQESDDALGLLTDQYFDDCEFQIAEVHAQRGEIDAAFEWLERIFAVNGSGLSSLRPSPELRPLHADPRWRPILRRAGLEA